jgi:hypothetical protein
VKVSICEVASVELARLKRSQPKLGKTSVSSGDQEILAFSFHCTKAGQAAIYKFRAHSFQADSLSVGKITFHQAHVLQPQSSQVTPGKAHALQDAGFKDD